MAFSDRAEEGARALLASYAESGDTASIERLHTFSASAHDLARVAADQVPVSAQDELVAAAETVERIDAAATEACEECGGSTTPLVFTATSTDLPTLPTPGPDAPDTRTEAGEGGTGGVTLPDVDPDDLPPGSVNPGQASGTTTATTVLDPVRDLTGGLTGALDPDGDKPVTSGVTEPVRDLGGLLNQTLDPATGLGDTLQDTTDGVGDTVDDLGDTLTGQQ